MFESKNLPPKKESYFKMRNRNSTIIGEYILEQLGEKWDKIKNCKPGEKDLDSILIYLFFSKNRVITPNSKTYNDMGIIDRKSKIIIDFIDKEKHKIKKLKYSEKGFAVFAYETVLDVIYNAKHSFVWNEIEDVRPANRNKFKTFKIVENLEDHELEFD